MSERTKVINIKDAPDGWKSEPTGLRKHVYIGRAGHGFNGFFGNPLGSLDGYPEWLINRIQTDPGFRRNVRYIAGKTLVCFCAPKFCHGDVLAIFADTLADMPE